MSAWKFRRTIFLVGLLLIASHTNLLAQLRLGPQNLVSMAAPALRNPQHLSIGLKSQAFVGKIGGVAFDQVAQPDEDLSVNDLSLHYRPDLPDGKRLQLMVNGQLIYAHIYDWQLIPIAKFADSPYFSCFTLFGKLKNTTKEKEVLEKGGRILNYHPSLVDTLLGLRIFQLDILILHDFITDLPKEGEEYILGAGESMPNFRMNKIGMKLFAYYINIIQSELQTRHRSYVICDFEQDIHFSFHGNTLNIEGQPFYYFWRYKRDQPGYDNKATHDRVLQEIQEKIKSEKKSNAEGFNERKCLIDALVLQAKNYQERYQLYSSGTVVDLINIQDDDSRRSFLSRYHTNSLYKLLVNMRVAMDAYEILYLKDYSELISSKPELLHGINPTVWNSAVQTMRYAAFFRFCKTNFPESWLHFIRQIENIAVAPRVQTPTVMQGAEDKKKADSQTDANK